MLHGAEFLCIFMKILMRCASLQKLFHMVFLNMVAQCASKNLRDVNYPSTKFLNALKESNIRSLTPLRANIRP